MYHNKKITICSFPYHSFHLFQKQRKSESILLRQQQQQQHENQPHNNNDIYMTTFHHPLALKLNKKNSFQHMKKPLPSLPHSFKTKDSEIIITTKKNTKSRKLMTTCSSSSSSSSSSSISSSFSSSSNSKILHISVSDPAFVAALVAQTRRRKRLF
ncbi:unnamed protein product [Cunninghamella echinulata]